MTKLVIGGVIALGLTVFGGAAIAQRMGPSGFPFKSGEETYSHLCQGCHMPDAKGAVGAAMYGYPALAGDPKLASGLYPAMVIVKGQKAMPNFADLTDDQVAGVVNYVRSHFGNKFADEITAAQVKAIRPPPVTSENRRPG